MDKELVRCPGSSKVGCLETITTALDFFKHAHTQILRWCPASPEGKQINTFQGLGREGTTAT